MSLVQIILIIMCLPCILACLPCLVVYYLFTSKTPFDLLSGSNNKQGYENFEDKESRILNYK